MWSVFGVSRRVHPRLGVLILQEMSMCAYMAPKARNTPASSSGGAPHVAPKLRAQICAPRSSHTIWGIFWPTLGTFVANAHSIPTPKHTYMPFQCIPCSGRPPTVLISDLRGVWGPLLTPPRTLAKMTQFSNGSTRNQAMSPIGGAITKNGLSLA